MTDFAGTEEPAGTDDKALEEPVPIVPIGPGAAAAAVPAVLVEADPLDAPDLEAEPEGRIEQEQDDPVALT